MTALPYNLYRASQVRELDRTTIEDFGIPGYTLMQRAGQAAFQLLVTRWPEARKLLILAGPGNNGGDGYVIARLALKNGFRVHVIQMGDPARIRGDALKARTAYLEVGGNVVDYDGNSLSDCDVIVDALLGTGLEREVSGQWKAAIEAINAHPSPVLAVDIPSGLHSDQGIALGEAVRAHCTISFIGLKQGQFTASAADYCGDIFFDDLQVPDGVYAAQTPSVRKLTLEQFHDRLSPRLRNSNKGQFGHALIIGGEHGMSGAARMAAEAAARIGAGLVSVATRDTHAAMMNLTRPELMVHGVEAREHLQPLLERATAVAIGPGLGQSAWSHELFAAAMEVKLPLVLDADALNLLAKQPRVHARWVLTPHPGEAARLLSNTSRMIQEDRYSAAEALQSRYGGVCVLKGAGTVVRSDDRTSVCTAGNPGMASGGMGDVLTGMIVGLLAQGFSLVDGAELGVCVHGAAGDAAVAEGERGLIATDLFKPIRALINP
jgi:NAD(P)H-hydrate epimerase